MRGGVPDGEGQGVRQHCVSYYFLIKIKILIRNSINRAEMVCRPHIYSRERFQPTIKAVSSTEMLGQHRTIRQEVSGRICSDSKFENGGILYVFPIFGTAEAEQKDG